MVAVPLVWFVCFAQKTVTEAFQEFDAGRPDRALPILDRYLDSHPEDVQAWLCYARCSEQVAKPGQGHLQDALKAYRSVAAIRPLDGEPWARLAQLNLAMGNEDLAAQAARQATRLGYSSDLPDGHFMEMLSANGRPDDLKQFIENHADATDWRTKLLVVDAKLSLGQEPKAVLASALVRETAEDGAKHFLAAKVYSYMFNRDEAVRELGLGIADSPADPFFLRTVVRLCTDLQAESIGVNYLSRHPACLNDPHLGLWDARQQWQQSNWSQVVQTVARNGPRRLATEPEANFLLYLALRKLGRKAERAQLLDRLEEEAQYTEVARRWFRLIQYVELNQGGKSDPLLADILQEVLEVHPASPIVRMLHASVYYRQGEYEVAARLAADAIRLAPSWFHLWHLHVTAECLAGRIVQASTAAQQMQHRFPGNPNAELIASVFRAAALRFDQVEAAKQFVDWSTNRETSDDPSSQRLLQIATLFAKQIAKSASSTEDVSNESDRNFGQRDVLQGTLGRQLKIELARYFYSCTFTGADSLAIESQDAIPGSSDALSFLADASIEDTQPEAELIRERKDLSSKGAIGWRVLEARRLLRNRSEKNAALAATVLRPVVSQFPWHGDANLLLGLALLRLRDRESGVEHWFIAAESNLGAARQCMRLSLHVRKEGRWKDTKSLVDFWRNAGSTLDRDDEARSKRITESLLLLAAYAEETEDLDLAEVCYRSLLRFDREVHIAMNNLAYLLLRCGGDLAEAESLAKQALSANPDEPEYQHTYREVVQAVRRPELLSKHN
ncbi:MAG: tetratricopeptide repeat protein [Aureliella sp.]